MRHFKLIAVLISILGILSCGFFKEKLQQSAEEKIKEELQKQIDENIRAIDSTKIIVDSLLNQIDLDSLMMMMDSSIIELQKLKKEFEEKNK